MTNEYNTTNDKKLGLVNKLSCAETDTQLAGRLVAEIMEEKTLKLREDEKETINKLINRLQTDLNAISYAVNQEL